MPSRWLCPQAHFGRRGSSFSPGDGFVQHKILRCQSSFSSYFQSMIGQGNNLTQKNRKFRSQKQSSIKDIFKCHALFLTKTLKLLFSFSWPGVVHQKHPFDPFLKEGAGGGGLALVFHFCFGIFHNIEGVSGSVKSEIIFISCFHLSPFPK